jgi:allophanate hydrolase subunit 2
VTLAIVRALGLVTVQDGGRPGRMHEGLARGGALVRAGLGAANRALGNPAFAPGLEVLGKLVVRATVAIEVACDAWEAPRVLAAGDEVSIESEPRRVAYLAVRGGIAAPLVLGSASVHLAAGLGAPVAVDDVIRAADAPGSARYAIPREGMNSAPIRVVAGPDARAFAPDALAALISAPYRISPTSDRVGTRLSGPEVPRSAAPDRTRPMVRGALEVPRDGQPIVLGPEHPTTGGYPIVAVIVDADLDRFFSIRLGGRVAFEVGHGATSPARS